jgi:tripeptidyl-peptidase I
MSMNVLLCLLAFVVTLDAIAIPPHHEIHERRETLQPRWMKRERVESHKLLPMRIGLTQKNLENGYEHLLDV